ncbi:MAG: tRNA pseudouridine(55) synthase TruB [Aquificaceae bacterium]
MLSGLLLVDKPKGMTSMQVVEGIKSRFKVKAGHTGTLDPIATGLMLILVGEATKFSQFFTSLDKAYVTTAKLGEIKNTYDAEGETIELREVNLSCEQIREALKDFLGRITQIPPSFSAKRVEGERAYKLARKGLEVKIKPVEVEVYRAEMLKCSLPYVEILFEVSSGTYIRSLVHDLGMKLSCGAHVVELRRTRVGKFHVEKAVSYQRLMSLDDIKGLLIPIDEALDFLPKINLRGEISRRIKRGSIVKLPTSYEKTFLRLYEGENFIGIGLIEGDKLRPYRLMQGL